MRKNTNTYLIENVDITNLLNKDPELTELIGMFLNKLVDYVDIIEYIEEIAKKRNRKISEKKLDSLKNDFKDVYEGDLCFASKLIGKKLNNGTYGKGYTFEENEIQIREQLLNKNIDLIFDIFNEELNSEISERINLTIEYINGLLEKNRYISVGKTSTIKMFQDEHGDLCLKKIKSKIIEENYGEKRNLQQDLFEKIVGGTFVYQKVELSEETNYLNIYEHPEGLYMALVEFCIKNSYFPIEIEKIKKGNIKPLIANTSTFGFDKLTLRTFKENLSKKEYSKFAIFFGTIQGEGSIKIFQDRIEILDKNDKIIMIIEKELVGPLLIGLNNLPGRSLSTINKINELFIEKYNHFLKNK